jgi:hypothetical protein
MKSVVNLTEPATSATQSARLGLRSNSSRRELGDTEMELWAQSLAVVESALAMLKFEM